MIFVKISTRLIRKTKYKEDATKQLKHKTSQNNGIFMALDLILALRKFNNFWRASFF